MAIVFDLCRFLYALMQTNTEESTREEGRLDHRHSNQDSLPVRKTYKSQLNSLGIFLQLRVFNCRLISSVLKHVERLLHQFAI